MVIAASHTVFIQSTSASAGHQNKVNILFKRKETLYDYEIMEGSRNGKLWSYFFH